MASAVLSREGAWEVVAEVTDPEIPVLTIEDLGILRDVQIIDGTVIVTLTPTYSGCPAIDQMGDDVTLSLTAAGYSDVKVEFSLTPAWTTDWMSDEGRRKLTKYGIAPPGPRPTSGPIPVQLGVKCPRCESLRTRTISQFGSTSCKALYECLACLEPFDYFKPH